MVIRIARWIHLAAAWILVVGLMVQVFIAGLGVFSDATAFTTHRDVGYWLTALPFVLVVTALVGRLGRWQIAAGAVMFGQFILQSVFVLQRDSMPEIAALHPLNGFLVLLIAVWVGLDGWRSWRSQSPAGNPAVSSEPSGG